MLGRSKRGRGGEGVQQYMRSFDSDPSQGPEARLDGFPEDGDGDGDGELSLERQSENCPNFRLDGEVRSS